MQFSTNSQAGVERPASRRATRPRHRTRMALPEAIGKQLELKLEKKKRPVSVLAIDHIERKPTDN